MCKEVWSYQDGYIDGVEEALEAASVFLSENVIRHIKEKQLEFYKNWKTEEFTDKTANLMKKSGFDKTLKELAKDD